MCLLLFDCWSYPPPQTVLTVIEFCKSNLKRSYSTLYIVLLIFVRLYLVGEVALVAIMTKISRDDVPWTMSWENTEQEIPCWIFGVTCSGCFLVLVKLKNGTEKKKCVSVFVIKDYLEKCILLWARLNVVFTIKANWIKNLDNSTINFTHYAHLKSLK